MLILSLTTEVLMKAVISAPPTDVACTVHREFNYLFTIHMAVECSFKRKTPNTRPCMLLFIGVCLLPFMYSVKDMISFAMYLQNITDLTLCIEAHME